MRPSFATVLAIAGVLHAAPALSCDCIPWAPYFTLPADGAVDVPLNAPIFLTTLGWGPNDLALVDTATEAPIAVEHRVGVMPRGGQANVLVPIEPLAANRTYQVLLRHDGDFGRAPDLLLSFTTGTQSAALGVLPVPIVTRTAAASTPVFPMPGVNCGAGTYLEVQSDPDAAILLFQFSNGEGGPGELPAHFGELTTADASTLGEAEFGPELPFTTWTPGPVGNLRNTCGGAFDGGFMQPITFRVAHLDQAGNLSPWSAWQTKTLPPPFISCSFDRADGSRPWATFGVVLILTLFVRRRRHRPRRVNPT